MAGAGGAACPRPTRQGFGKRLIRQSFVNQLHGAVRLSFDPPGVVCEIDVPLVAIIAPPSD
jgi:two-component sensor histidine kinase